MTSLETALRQIGADLTRAHVSFALVGGLAVSVRTEPRFTRDADLGDGKAPLIRRVVPMSTWVLFHARIAIWTFTIASA